MERITSLQLVVSRLKENVEFLNHHFTNHGMSWTFVIKLLSNSQDTLIAQLSDLPVKSIATENLNHLSLLKSVTPEIETWFLNYSAQSPVPSFVDVNLSHAIEFSDTSTCLMVALDPEREGCDPQLVKNEICSSSCSRIGAYLDCAHLPDTKWLTSWKENNFPGYVLQSLGTSVSFSLMKQMADAGVNHYRVGELAFFGKDLVSGKKVNGLRHDVFESNKCRSYHEVSMILNKTMNTSI
jgi:ornithine racemase